MSKEIKKEIIVREKGERKKERGTTKGENRQWERERERERNGSKSDWEKGSETEWVIAVRDQKGWS
jgi:hypothetical protein